MSQGSGVHVIVACAGSGERWNGAFGVPKQLLGVGGETILARTVRQCLARCARVTVSAPVGRAGEKFRVDGAALLQPEQNAEWYGTARYYATRDHWTAEGDERTVILHGDVWFTDQAIDTILSYRGDYTAFLRLGDNDATGKKHAELFGIGFAPETHDELLKACEEVAHYRHTHVTFRAIGFEVWRYLAGVRGKDVEYRYRIQENVGRCTLIDDETDDVDEPHDYHRLLYRRAVTAPVTEGVTSVVIPWKPNADPLRARNLEWLLNKLRRVHPTWEVHLASDDRVAGQPWCKAAAVLNALTQSRGDVIVQLDADVWSDRLGDTVQAIRDGRARVACPHTHVRRLSPKATEDFVAGRPFGHSERQHERLPYKQSAGGLPVVAERAVMMDVPLDQRFQGWGYEDVSWGMAVETLVEPIARFEDIAIHLFHEPDPARVARQAGEPAQMTATEFESQGLYFAYKNAVGNPTRMREIVEEAKYPETGPS